MLNFFNPELGGKSWTQAYAVVTSSARAFFLMGISSHTIPLSVLRFTGILKATFRLKLFSVYSVLFCIYSNLSYTDQRKVDWSAQYIQQGPNLIALTVLKAAYLHTNPSLSASGHLPYFFDSRKSWSKVGQPGSVHATRISFVSIFFFNNSKVNFRVISLADERISKYLHAWVSFQMKNRMILIPILKSRKSTEYRMHIYNHWLIK